MGRTLSSYKRLKIPSYEGSVVLYRYLLNHENELGIRTDGCSRHHVICYGERLFHAQIGPVSRVNGGEEETRD